MARFHPRLLVELRSYSAAKLRADLVAGVTVAIIALPLAMALSIASGVKPEQGLYTAIVAGFLISALGGSRLQIGGPTGAFVIIVLQIINAHGYQGLAISTLLAGFILIALGAAGLGRMIKFFPYPLVTGFTSGIALIIFTTQIKDLLGLRFDDLPLSFLETWETYILNLYQVNYWAVCIGLCSLIAIIFLRKFNPRIPSALVVVIAGSLLVELFNLPVETVGSRFGDLPRTLPYPALPQLPSLSNIGELIAPALTIALLAGIESLLSAVVADGMTSDRHDSNTELIAQGIANIFSTLFGGIPATGAIARTATNVKSGACSPVSGIIHALTLLLFMLLLAPFAKLIPIAVLASILIVVAWNMSHFAQFRSLLRGPRSDAAVMIVVFVLTVLVDLTVAVEAGVVMAALLFMKRMSEVFESSPVAAVFQDEPSVGLAKPVLEQREIPPGVEVFQMAGPFFFGVADRLKDVLTTTRGSAIVFILRMRQVPVVDATGMHALRDLQQKCGKQGTTLLISGANPRVYEKMERFGLVQEIGRENFCENIDVALRRAELLLRDNQVQL